MTITMAQAGYSSVPEIRTKYGFLWVLGIAVPVVLFGFFLHKRYDLFRLKRKDNNT